MIKNFLKDNGENFIFTGYRMEIYIPESMFATKKAEIEGTFVKTFGVLPCIIRDKNNKILTQEILNLPTVITLHFNNIYKTTINLYGENYEAEPYRVLTFFTNDVVMASSVPQDSKNAEIFLNLLIDGKLTHIPYDLLLQLWQKNLEINKVNLGAPASILEIIITEVYRNPNNPNEKFSKYINKNPKAPRDYYRASNIREICSRNSTFAALTFEDFDTMMTASLNMNKYNKKQVESPIEKVLKM